MIAAEVVADSIADGVRLSTLVVTMPRFILAEFNTHRAFSRNSASSRAVPVLRAVEAVERSPFVPSAFGAARAGMQAGENLDADSQLAARHAWLDAAQWATQEARRLERLNVHKQWANRLLEPFAWHTVVVSATDFESFFTLRDHADAQPEIRDVARAMRFALEHSTPSPMHHGGYHLPWGLPLASAVARCARVSYLRQDVEPDIDADAALCERLQASGHWSPFEHVACVSSSHYRPTNFAAPWLQYRRVIGG